MLFNALIISLGLSNLISAQSTSLWPAALPLAVRSPYLNSYLNAATTLPNQWPVHWNENRVLGWSAWIRVDGTAYELWGQSGTGTNLTNVEITPTSTIMSITAESMDVTVTFLSPIEPDNLVLQSLPFSYISFEATSNDGASHVVQFYSDISCEWISGDSANLARWNTTQTESSTYHMCTRQSPDTAGEILDQVEDAMVFFAMHSGNGATYQTGNDTLLRPEFASNGVLDNSADTKFRAISDDFVVMGHAASLGTISSTSSPVVMAIGLVRDPAIIMTSPSGNETRSSYFFTEYSTVGDAIDFFLGEYTDAKSRADALDDKVITAAKAVSADYVDLVSLAARQALAVDITVGESSSGSGFNTSDVMTFMRDVGQSRRSNPVEVIYAAFPTYLYFNATWAGYLLEPLLKYQASSQYSREYAAPDLGAVYPYINGNSNPNIFGALEDSGNMLIMGWEHARFSGDGSMLKQYYSLYKSFADYMIANNAIHPNGYTDADGVDNANMTNLALKAILGVKAMAEISAAVGESSDADTYSSQASSYISTWKGLADSQGHLVSTYNTLSSWGLIYNLYSDKLMGTKLVDDSIYTQQDTFYASQAEVAGDFGLQYDSTVPDEVKAHWTLFAAGAASDSSVRDTLIAQVHTKATTNTSDTAGVFPLTYVANNGSTLSGQASPGQGAMFSILALGLDAQDVAVSSGSSGSSSSHVGPIVGGVIAGLAVIGLAVGFFFWRRRQQKKNHQAFGSQESGWAESKPETRQAVPLVADYTPAEQGYNPYAANSNGTGYQAEPLAAPVRSNSTATATTETQSQAASAMPVPIVPAMYPPPQSGKSKAGLVHLTYGNPMPEPSVYPQSSSGASTTEGGDSHLRSEVENLRREMEEMRARTQYEPPPQYD